MLDKYVIITAGGTGNRMGTVIPKQFLLLNALPVIMHSMKAFYQYSEEISIIVVLPESQPEVWAGLCKEYQFKIPHKVCTGGITRFESVRKGLEHSGEGIIAVHDAVRPLLSPQLIRKCFSVAEEKGNAVPVIPLKDSVRSVESGKSQAVDRKPLHLVQTPQVFISEQIKSAYQRATHKDFTDDATVVEAAGLAINLVEGEERNIKITTPADMLIAAALIDRY